MFFQFLQNQFEQVEGFQRDADALQPDGEAFHHPPEGILLRRLVGLNENRHLVGQPFHAQEIGVAQRLEKPLGEVVHIHDGRQ